VDLDDDLPAGVAGAVAQIWRSGGPIGDYGRADFVAYFVAAFLIRQLTASWVVWDLSAQIASGDLSTLLMRPVHPLLHHVMQNLAALPVRMVLAVPLGVVVLVLAGGVSLDAGRGRRWCWCRSR
jgi:ABC-2 type transport system permease protein